MAHPVEADSTRPSSASVLTRFCVTIYGLCVLAVACLLATSPVLRAIGVSDFDRLLDGTTIVLLATRLLEMLASGRISNQRGFLVALMVGGYFAAAGALNAVYNPLFQPALLLLDGKILLLVICLWAFGDRPIVSEQLRRRWSAVLLGACILGTALFVLTAQSGARLKLIEESNYMIVAFSIVAIVYFTSYRSKPGSLSWFAIFGFLAVACIVAQSRTGFAVVAGLAILHLASRRQFKWLLTLVLISATALLATGDEIVETVTRGSTSVDNIDRIIFLREYLAWTQSNPPATVLFGSHVGTYLTERPLYMDFWVTKQSAQHGIPYGLAPFNFHSAYLRILADFGVVPGLALLVAVVALMRRSMNMLVVIVVLIAAVSMSVFYLSSIMPLLVVAQLIRPARIMVRAPTSRAVDTAQASSRM
jgi:hypothetical protein